MDHRVGRVRPADDIGVVAPVVVAHVDHPGQAASSPRSPVHPWLAIEGDSVRVTLPGGTALATAVRAPPSPEEGQFPVPATTACTFTVTLAPRGGSLPLSASAFSITDEEGHVHQPVVTALGEGAPPARLDGTHPVTLTISSVLPTGNGTLHWAPTGHKAVVSWDFGRRDRLSLAQAKGRPTPPVANRQSPP